MAKLVIIVKLVCAYSACSLINTHALKRKVKQPNDTTRMASVSPVVFDELETLHATWSLGSRNVPAPPPIALTATYVSKRPSASLRHSTVTPGEPFCDVPAWLRRETFSRLLCVQTGGQPGMTPTLTHGQP